MSQCLSCIHYTYDTQDILVQLVFVLGPVQVLVVQVLGLSPFSLNNNNLLAQRYVSCFTWLLLFKSLKDNSSWLQRHLHETDTELLMLCSDANVNAHRIWLTEHKSSILNWCIQKINIKILVWKVMWGKKPLVLPFLSKERQN